MGCCGAGLSGNWAEQRARRCAALSERDRVRLGCKEDLSVPVSDPLKVMRCSYMAVADRVRFGCDSGSSSASSGNVPGPISGSASLTREQFLAARETGGTGPSYTQFAQLPTEVEDTSYTQFAQLPPEVEDTSYTQFGQLPAKPQPYTGTETLISWNFYTTARVCNHPAAPRGTDGFNLSVDGSYVRTPEGFVHNRNSFCTGLKADYEAAVADGLRDTAKAEGYADDWVGAMVLLWDEFVKDYDFGTDVNVSSAFGEWVVTRGSDVILGDPFMRAWVKYITENPPAWLSEGDADGDGQSDGWGYWDPSGSDTVVAVSPVELLSKLGTVTSGVLTGVLNKLAGDII